MKTLLVLLMLSNSSIQYTEEELKMIKEIEEYIEEIRKETITNYPSCPDYSLADNIECA